MLERFETFSFSIFEIWKYWHKLASEEMAKYQLKGTHCVYLLALSRSRDGLTAPQLCEACGKDKSDVSRMMASMEAKGLVTKDGIHQNRYGGAFRLTEGGIAAAAQIQRRVRQAVEIAGKDLSAQERASFYKALAAITRNMRTLSEQGIPEA